MGGHFHSTFSRYWPGILDWVQFLSISSPYPTRFCFGLFDRSTRSVSYVQCSSFPFSSLLLYASCCLFIFSLSLILFWIFVSSLPFLFYLTISFILCYYFFLWLSHDTVVYFVLLQHKYLQYYINAHLPSSGDSSVIAFQTGLICCESSYSNSKASTALKSALSLIKLWIG